MLARRELERIFREENLGGLPRGTRLELARLSRRAGMPLAGVRLLHPLARPAVREHRRATPGELAEYAASLAQIGAEEEAGKILDSLDARENPEILLFGAFARFARWNYADAIPLLETYVNSGTEEYARLVGQINLAAAYVAESRFDRADPLLAGLLASARAGEHRLVAANALLLQAQAAIDRRRWREAARMLGEAAAGSGEVATLDALYVEKWRVILSLERTQGARDALASASSLRRRAEAARAWETLRDLDFHQAVSLRDAGLFARVYWGTPYAAYRRRLENSPMRARLSMRSAWDTGANPRREVDLFHGVFKPGQLLWRLAACLTADAYRPVRLAAVHAALFPERHFHPLHSPNVVHQAVRRFRAELGEAGVALELREESGAYRILSRRAVRLLLPATGATAPEALRLEEFFSARGRAPFARRELETKLALSERAAAYLVARAVKEGWLLAEGAGRSRRYALPPQRAGRLK